FGFDSDVDGRHGEFVDEPVLVELGCVELLGGLSAAEEREREERKSEIYAFHREFGLWWGLDVMGGMMESVN
ncbi:MAG: hypothetical protein K2H58_05580, partial [Paramuribaculum sp.]|nr:hypothetical protein [Paramuribaculum sp.]